MRLGVSKGLHTVDTGLIVAPLIHKTVKLVADAVGIEYEEGIVDKKATEETKKMRKEALTKKFLKSVKKDQPTETEDEVVLVEDVMEEPVQGLIPRRNK
jgi:ABC-type oligopeptide transport system ATPase subunit